jgi:hypothetical protein
MDELTTSLLDLHFELDRLGISLTIGGGFGLYLKRTHVASTGERTLFEALPVLRVTNDIDLFLRAEVIADPERTAEVASVVRSLGYDAIPGAEYYQWSRTRVVDGTPREVKLDLLVGPTAAVRSRLHGDARRVRPKGKSVGLHAHPTEEAVGLEENPIPIPVVGRRSDGSDYRGTVFVPRAFPYLMMKLHAFDDRKDDAAKELGRHHALDLFTLVGIMTEAEYEDSVRMGRELASAKQVDRSRRIVNQSFSAPTAIGPLRLREHPLFRADFAVVEFIEVLAEIFSHGPGGR